MKVDNETYSFAQDSFIGNVSNVEENLAKALNMKGEIVNFNNVIVSTYNKNNIVFRGNIPTNEGKIIQKEIYDNKEAFLINLPDITSGTEIYREYTCLATSFSESSENDEITCNTSPNQHLKNEICKFDGQVSIGDGVVTFNMNNPTDRQMINKENSISNSNNIS